MAHCGKKAGTMTQSADGDSVVLVLLVDRQGRILMQHRDEHAPVAPNQWSAPGGHLEPDEEPEAGARRELLEETGLRVAGPLALFRHELRPSSHQPGRTTEWHVYYAATTARDDDIVIGEGLAMRFIAPDAARALDLGTSAAYFIPLFLDSPEYARLITTS